MSVEVGGPRQRASTMVRTNRRVRWLATPLAFVLAVTMFEQPSAAEAAPKWDPPKPKEVAGLQVTDARPKAARAAFSAESRTVRQPRPVSWPAAGTATVRPKVAGAGRAGELPVTVSAVESEGSGARALAGPDVVSVRMFDRAATTRAGVQGVLLGLRRADGRTGNGQVSVEVDFSEFAHAFGGDWASRLRLVRRPECAASTPQLAECQTSTPVPTVNDPQASTVSARLNLSGEAMTLLAVQADSDGDNGDYKATDLSPAGAWEVSTQTGDFSWSYELRMPPSLGGPAPSVSLAYSSGSVDGMTAMTNNQGGWVGDGWTSWPGFIERRYASCGDDNPDHKTGDLCWFSDNATLSLNGRAGELVRSGSVWRLKNDDGTKIERVTDSTRNNGDDDNEYWKVTTTDGVQYYFGYHRLPGWSSDKPVTNSTWTAPVYGNNSGEPCYHSTFANARCDQGWRWNLDYVVDPNNNSLAYFYKKETGAYGRNNTPTQRTTYDRGGYLDRIEYGMRKGSEYSAAAPLRVTFETNERCLSNCWTGTAWTSDPKPNSWPDTPWDQYCKESPCVEQNAPTFWSARRLTKVTAQLRNGTSSYRDVESWALRHEFINAGTGEGTPMWLRGVTRTGHVTTAGGVAVSDPEITFNPGAEPLANRVDGPSDQRTELNRWRIKQIRTESGGDILITYSGHDCTRGSLPTPHSNTKRCMPAYFSWPGSGDPTLDWFHKYVVTRIDQDDLVTDQPNQTTFYDYLDTPAWAYNTDELTKDKHRTWGDWRGYGRVRVRQGDPTNGVQTSVEYRYLRGMHGDKQPNNGSRDVQVVDTWGGSITDHEALQGFVRQEITYNGVSSGGVNGAEVSSTLNEPWRRGPTATRTRNGVTTNAWMVNNASTRTRTALATGGFRITKTATTYNPDGLPTAVDDAGDENVTGDETCTRTSYARNDDSWMIDRVSQKETLSVRCADAPSTATPATVLKRERSFYDSYTGDSSFGAAPTRGNVVRAEDLDRFNGSTPVYVRTQSTSYDGNGRVTSTTDARGYSSTTDYTTANGGLLTQTVETNPLGHTKTTAREPAWNLATRVTDENGAFTDLTYDGLGRLTNVWLPGRNKANQTPSTKISYLVRNSGGPTAVTTESLLVTGSTYKKSVTLYDGFLRERQSQTQATGGGRLLAETFHNARGEVEWTSEPYYDSTNAAPSNTLGTPQGQIPSITQNVYDGAGRQTAEIFKALGVEKWRTSTSHGGDRTHVTAPQGGIVSTVITDAKGQTTRLRQYKNRTDVGSTDPATYDETQYTYTLLGQQKTIKDPAGNTWSYSYDLRGREIQSVDPDKGTTNSTYDVEGNVLTVTAPLGNGTATVAYTYDELGRKTSVRDDSPTGVKRADWVFDTLPNGKGKLTSTTRYIGSEAWTSRTDSYDAFGRTTSTSLVVPSSEAQLCAAAPNPCVYTTTTSYRVNGQVHQVNLPAAADLPAERLTFGYNDLSEDGSLLSAAQIYVGAVTYNKLGQLTGRELGQYGSRVAVTSDFDEPTRRLKGTNVVPELQPEAANWSYEHDAAGNITKIKEQPQGQTADTQCYNYDHLRRLTRAWTPGSGDCAVSPTVAGLGGPAPYWHSWTFDVTGNRLTETRHAGTSTTFTYTHPPAGSARPHTVTNVTATGGVSWSRNYGYDNAGNTVTRPTASGATQSLVWNREGDLESVTEGGSTTSFRYDTEGNRLTRADATGKTLYLPGGLEIRYTNATAAKTATRYYTHAEAVVAMRTGQGLYWILGDHHGTAEITINAATLAVAKRRTLPYGDTRGSAVGTWPAAMDKGFVGGTKDPTGLTHIGAREYDPFIGRFISVDPVIDYADPQQMHGYAYSNNNPVSFTDPDGEFLRSIVQKATNAAKATGKFLHDNAGNISLGLGVAAMACSVIPPLQVAAPFLAAASAGFGAYDAGKSFKNGEYTDAAVGVAGLIPGGKAVIQAGKLIKATAGPATKFTAAKFQHMKVGWQNHKFQQGARRPGQDESYRKLAYQMETQGMMFADFAVSTHRRVLGEAADQVIKQPKTGLDFMGNVMLLENVNYNTCKWYVGCESSRHATLFPQQAPRNVVKASSGARGSGSGGYRPKATPAKNSPSAPVRTPTYNWTPGRLGGI
ncbi:RHS repeat-associated core domain-containing protein [Micromonospora palythoicola]|uniref:RHS repeat-associated core domain-containing protein n=1 Tax=Micromonospora palythoicola TaxID=3120507 RepID=UPI002FCDE726